MNDLPQRLTVLQVVQMMRLLQIGLNNAPSKAEHMHTAVNPKDILAIMRGKN